MSAELRTIPITHAEPDEFVDGFLQAVARGFHDSRVKPEVAAIIRGGWQADEATVRGGWLTGGSYGAGPMPIATFLSFDKTMRLGPGDHGLVPLRMITDITVSPAHRRQGWLSRLMTADLADAVEQGVPVAALTVSEATIYGRYGFAPATFRHRVEVASARTGQFRLRDDAEVAAGRAELIEPAALWPAAEATFDHFHASTRGSVARPAAYRSMLTAELGRGWTAGNDQLRAAVWLGPDGAPAGHVTYEVKWGDEETVLTVHDLVAAEPGVQLALWRFLAEIDLVDKIKWGGAPVDHPLRWALADAFAYVVKGQWEHIWVRVLDVRAALGAREWAADGAVVLGVADKLGYADGRWQVEVSNGRAEVRRTDREPDVTLGVEALATLSAGGASVPALRRSGRIAGEPAAVAALSAMADLAIAPYSVTSF
ncbi:GNAT family N-acetyltransferase [Nocardioides limicola]|uniref:GNAT family N-acetyltransferase n=1 Tax=Nocardioides limicola TaxID=2803368 RepID=UPI00193B06E3|nr:GNAT family N-acetyltransferase [Nocardioides sp. DJM-14]